MARNIVLFLPELLLRPRSRTLMFLPLAQVLAGTVQVICLGAGTTLGHNSDAKELLEDLSRFKPTFLKVVPGVSRRSTPEPRTKRPWRAGNGCSGRPPPPRLTIRRPSRPAAQGTGAGAGPVSRAEHALFDRLLYPKLRHAFRDFQAHIAQIYG
ncbi:MAG: long-chain fatty acid--CoA ligase [Arthrobacter sp.]|nr:long-chain fatty acid--CoA ligase [Arthrobacter sp.]